MDINKLEIQFDVKKYEKQILAILKRVKNDISTPGSKFDGIKLRKILNEFPQDGNSVFSRGQLVMGYHELVKTGLFKENKDVLLNIRMKPMRTQSGVTPVTVLTKPFPCPGKCIFCPNDIRMPKSYLANEPGAQRAERNSFDPYLQTYNRLLAFHNIGHSTDKVELIVLGGTWSFYPEYYQIWFIKRCFDALNDFGIQDGRSKITTENIFSKRSRSKKETKKTYNQIVMDVAGGRVHNFFKDYEKATWKDLEKSQTKNETSLCRNVGLVIETRPDFITEKEVIKIRKLGGTKVQVGIQTLDDEVNKLNKRGHTKKQSAHAFRLLRLAGFKIHAHWMANLYGSSVKKDIADYKQLWKKDFCPDELKIYPTSIIENTELFDIYQKGGYKPYTQQELLEVLSETIPNTPRYCRLTRIIRDIPSTDIIAGNKITNFRQLAEKYITDKGKKLQDIRSREIKLEEISPDDLEMEILEYSTSISKEFFLSYKTKKNDQIAAFLRLSLPNKELSSQNFIKEIQNCAMVREVHVYGQLVGLGKFSQGKAQHLGLGSALIEKGVEIAKKNGWDKLAVITAVGTKEYYRKRKFQGSGLYLIREI